MKGHRLQDFERQLANIDAKIADWKRDERRRPQSRDRARMERIRHEVGVPVTDFEDDAATPSPDDEREGE